MTISRRPPNLITFPRTSTTAPLSKVVFDSNPSVATAVAITDIITGTKDGGFEQQYRGIKDEKARKSVTIPFAPMKGSRIGELAAKFDIVMGLTPEAA